MESTGKHRTTGTGVKKWQQAAGMAVRALIAENWGMALVSARHESSTRVCSTQDRNQQSVRSGSGRAFGAKGGASSVSFSPSWTGKLSSKGCKRRHLAASAHSTSAPPWLVVPQSLHHLAAQPHVQVLPRQQTFVAVHRLAVPAGPREAEQAGAALVLQAERHAAHMRPQQLAVAWRTASVCLRSQSSRHCQPQAMRAKSPT